ncbi:MAG: hypothetical protein IPK97_15065 [Ahniella sp.]|nr:hypothetical protein [Ahniella sp.]
MNQSGMGNWSVSFGGGDLSFGTPTPVPADEALLAASGRAVPVGEHQYLWFDDQGNPPAPVGPDEALLLGQSPTFLRLDDHVAQLARQLGAPANAIQPLLAGLLQRGLLRSIRSLLPTRQARVPDAPAPVQIIRTCRRPAGLGRLLDSLLREQQTHGLTGPLYVIDDSGDPNAEAQTREALARFAAASGRPTGLLDGTTRERLLAPWRAGLDAGHQSCFDQLLSPERAPAAVPGRAFNWALLLGAGGTLSILDDDFSCP